MQRARRAYEAAQQQHSVPPPTASLSEAVPTRTLGAEPPKRVPSFGTSTAPRRVDELRDSAQYSQMYNKKQPNNDKFNELLHPFATMEDDAVTWHIKWTQICNENKIDL